MNLQIGIDLGGTKIECLVLNSNGERLWHQRVATPQGDYLKTLQAIVSLVYGAEQELKTIGLVGIGLPGSISPTTGLMRNATSTCLNGMPLKKDLELLLKRQIQIENDANCFALSEATDGAGKNAKTVFGVIIGTGTGAGFVCNGQVLTGCNGIAGEWGHNPLPWIRPEEYHQHDCWCGQKDCLETWLSGPALEKEYYQLTAIKKSVAEIIMLAEQGGQQEEQLIQAYETRLARGLAQIINSFDPDIIVLGGGLSNIQRLYQNIPKLWQQWVFSDNLSTRLVAPLYGDSSGVRGACWLTLQS